jgi:hypothetical protein
MQVLPLKNANLVHVFTRQEFFDTVIDLRFNLNRATRQVFPPAVVGWP